MRSRSGWILPSFLWILLLIAFLFVTIAAGTVFLAKQVGKSQERQLLWFAVQEKVEELKGDYLRGVWPAESSEIENMNGQNIMLTVRIHENKYERIREYRVQGKGEKEEFRYTLWLPRRKSVDQTTGLDTF